MVCKRQQVTGEWTFLHIHRGTDLSTECRLHENGHVSRLHENEYVCRLQAYGQICRLQGMDRPADSGEWNNTVYNTLAELCSHN